MSDIKHFMSMEEANDYLNNYNVKYEQLALIDTITENGSIEAKFHLFDGKEWVLIKANVPVIDSCDQGHQFAKLNDHPVNSEGRPRCPHCLAIGLDRSRQVERELFNKMIEAILKVDFNKLTVGEELIIRRSYERARIAGLKILPLINNEK